MADHPHDPDRPSNRLAGETSPYLLQHAQNPVDWFPWGPEAFAKARAEGKPLFLSIGYSACHWCHVMERESFESPAIASLMNENFVNVKVDREERPDVDQIYMAAVQALSGHGGWPTSVFLTPEGEPFFGGTYYPPADSRGMPGFPRVLQAVRRAWDDRRDEVAATAAELAGQIRKMGDLPRTAGALGPALLDKAAQALGRIFDPGHGGFGNAPKFPHPMDLKVLLREHARTGDVHALHMARHTLEKMARGGMYDHLGGGFARYSTDEKWLVPHFEKMLYDNALLASAYIEAYQLTGSAELATVARETLDYVIGRMTDPLGGFDSAEDADSEGEEGKFAVWSLAEVRSILGADRASAFAAVYDVSERGNWEGSNILNLPVPIDHAARRLGRDPADLAADLAEDRAKLLAARDRRIPPGKDTKVLASWNGLMIAAMAEAGHALGDDRYIDAARKAAGFLLDTMVKPDGRLLHAYKDGRARFDAYLDDYANLADGLTRLYEATGEPRWIDAALALCGVMVDEFADAEGGGFYFTSRDHEALIARTKDVQDNATPSGNAMAATALVRLAALTGRDDLEAAGRSALEAARPVMERWPTAAGQALIALDFLLGPTREIAVIGGSDPAEMRAALGAIGGRFLPRKVVAPLPEGPPPSAVALLADRPAVGGKVTAYICERFGCQAPAAGIEAIGAALDGLDRPAIVPKTGEGGSRR